MTDCVCFAQTLDSCRTKFPVTKEASHSILDAYEKFLSSDGSYVEYCPKPADDLYALVCSLFIIICRPKPSFFQTDKKDDIAKIRSFWKTCAGRTGWRRALDAAEACEYDEVKRILAEIFVFTPEWDAVNVD